MKTVIGWGRCCCEPPEIPPLSPQSRHRRSTFLFSRRRLHIVSRGPFQTKHSTSTEAKTFTSGSWHQTFMTLSIILVLGSSLSFGFEPWQWPKNSLWSSSLANSPNNQHCLLFHSRKALSERSRGNHLWIVRISFLCSRPKYYVLFMIPSMGRMVSVLEAVA